MRERARVRARVRACERACVVVVVVEVGGGQMILDAVRTKHGSTRVVTACVKRSAAAIEARLCCRGSVMVMVGGRQLHASR